MTAKKYLADTGVIPGRFQVLHNDHMRYLLAAKNLCSHLVVGVTNPDPTLTGEDPADPERSKPLSNPLTFFERSVMLSRALTEAGIDHGEYSIVPLPINFPELYRYYVPMDALFFVSIYDNWGRKKLEFFESLGLKTHVLWEVKPEEKGISAAEVRSLMVRGETWQHLVPDSCTQLLEAWNIPERLRTISENNSLSHQ